jgi:MFS transporter, GlpU family, inner membrane protein
MKNTKHSWLIIFCLVYSGEMIFSLPFHVPRFFRPTVLDVFGLNNAGLGDVFAVYGLVAMLAYFPGGVIADFFSARKLMAASLVATALGGLYYAQIPDAFGLALLFAYWGLTSILLFWAAMIKATREWGGSRQQGRAFGILEAGRGLVAAAAASVAVWILSLLLPSNLDALTHLQRLQAMQSVIYFYTLLTLFAALLIWFFIPEFKTETQATAVFSGIKSVIKQPIVWLQAVIIICAYCGYKGLDNYALYAHDVLNMNEIESAQFTSIAAYLRPIAALATGYIVDRFVASRVIVILFGVLFFSYLLLSFALPSSYGLNLIYANILITFVAVYGIRGVYFALIEETKVKTQYTGTAVGVISVIGFTPDVFFASISGRILDASPGSAGHHHYFLMLTGFAILGMLASFALATYKRRALVNG